ncbi:hypothetical protein E2562_000570 [Oryza meyeriana var. granulata]|uniref:Uncharacterized protein n=1 Tax=Oryza meyeriana var. granulata TaxID=110450 RepID=A0A6G1DTV2_9ORYZ|nr:hypothetical protein E2562_000570 [Oryza meyeriana var. granulata]
MRHGIVTHQQQYALLVKSSPLALLAADSSSGNEVLEDKTKEKKQKRRLEGAVAVVAANTRESEGSFTRKQWKRNDGGRRGQSSLRDPVASKEKKRRQTLEDATVAAVVEIGESKGYFTRKLGVLA